MNRRFFVNGVGLTLLSLLGFNRSRALTAQEPTPTPKADQQCNDPIVSAGPFGPVDDVSKGNALALMVFMLGVTQSYTPKNCATRKYYIDDLFPPPGQKQDFKKNFQRLGLDPTFLQNFVARAEKRKTRDEIRDGFHAVGELWDLMIVYGKPDCPRTDILTTIIKTAKTWK